MPDTGANSDADWLASAIRLGRTAHGMTWPNPSIGALIVKDGRLVGRGRTRPAGDSHAEVVAIKSAGRAARNATLYVSLEPCNHHGRTPPCVDAILAAGITRVVAPLADPNPAVAGGGFERLRKAGVRVDVGLHARLASQAHAGFFTRIERNRPRITLKLAVSSDGAIGRRDAGNVPITGSRARHHARALRSRFDGILVGAGTVRADNPKLTSRIPGLPGRSPVRLIVAGSKPLPLESHVFQDTAEAATWLLASEPRENPPLPAGVTALRVQDTAGGLNLAAAMDRLGACGLNRVLVEGGARIAKSLLEGDLVDEVLLYRAETIVGPGGVCALAGRDLASIEQGPDFRRIAMRSIGQDRLIRFERTRGA